MKDDKLTRRDFIKKATVAGAGLAAGGGLLTGLNALAQEKVYLPLILKSPEPTEEPTAEPTEEPTAEPTIEPPPPPTGSRVVHVHDSNATYWNFDSNYYGNYVRQDVVNNMVDQGVVALTGMGSVAQAWDTLFKAVSADGYQPGQSIAIKVNFNNCWWCDMCESGCVDDFLKTDALIHPINAVIRGLKLAYPSLNYSDIWIYDATVGDNPPNSERQIPGRFKDELDPLYSSVQFFDQGCNTEAGYTSSNPSANITWRNPGGIPTPPTRQVTDVLVSATYLINMPIMKKHGGTEVTLSFKNHAGSISNFKPFHDWTYHDGSHYSSSYNPLVDIYRNSNIQNKTVLTIADGLFGNWYRNETKSQPWVTFGNQAANSLLFATDPVAVDCVMCDLLNEENVQRGRGPLRDMADDYLVLAAAAGLGTYERGDPWQEPYGSGYSAIEYMRF